MISIKELHQKRRSSLKDGKASHTRAFLVVTDDIADGTAVALGATITDESEAILAAVPTIGQPHDKDTSAKATGIEASPVNDSGVHFEVTVEYAGTGVLGMPANPLDRPAEISYGFQDATESYFIDRSDPPKPVANSAGDPFDSFLERETGWLVLTINTNEPTHNPVVADAFSHTTNREAVTIDGITYAAGTLKLSPITAQKVKERIEEEGVVMEVQYYKRTYVLKARKDGWKEKPLDLGLNELIADPDPTKPGKLKPIVDSVNAPIRRPWPLNGAGRKKPKGTETAATLEFLPYAEASWSTLAFTWSAMWE